MPPRIDLIAHRGSSFLAPENTLAAFALGWQEATTCECDIHSTRDGRLVVIHDESTWRTTGADLLVAGSTLADLQQLDAGSWKGESWQGEKLPSLEEVISAMPEGKRLLIEIKSGPGTLPELARIIGASRKIGHLALQSFSPPVCAAMRELFPEVAIYLLVAIKQDAISSLWTPTLGEVMTHAVESRLAGIGVNDAGQLTREAVDAFHAVGLGLNVWTVDDPARAKRLRDLGVDGLITNRPGWLAANLE